MPPVPVHIDAPITPQKASTASATNNEAESQSPYPPAQPGAAAVPTPTPYMPNPQPQPQPTRTTPASKYSPPAPQPGAVPVPPSQQAPMTATSSLPPPPRPGEAAAQRQASVTRMPQQMGVPPPQQNYAPTHGTMPAAPTSQNTGPTTLNFGAAPAPQISAGSHPPGYHQNVNAQEMSSAARASLDQEDRRNSSAQVLGGFGGDNANDTAANAWNAMKVWANSAGTALIDAEKTVWERINKNR